MRLSGLLQRLPATISLKSRLFQLLLKNLLKPRFEARLDAPRLVFVHAKLGRRCYSHVFA